jgi:malate dehydrogenase (oxaloacetate-decarboxylating)(NADP+)
MFQTFAVSQKKSELQLSIPNQRKECVMSTLTYVPSKTITGPKQKAAVTTIAPESGKRGIDILHDPVLNKATGYTEAERQALGLVGLVPDATESEDLQLRRVLLQLAQKSTDLDRYVYLISLLDNDETLFYRTVMSDPARFLPIIYDPTIGEACLKFGHIYRRTRGMYLSITRKGHVKEVLRNWPVKDVRVICVTDAGRILGLGDLGANGMGIPIGKLQLYTACAGVPPQGLLPIYLDAGTNNEAYLNDPLYLGLRRKRPSTEELYAFVDEFVEAVREVFPDCCIHFEDWTGTDAIALLARYRDEACCYNDDIQGTAGVVLAGMINSLKITGGQLKDQRILFLGAGSAAIGLADLIVSDLARQGIDSAAARQNIRMFDTKGLVVAGRPGLEAHKLPYAHKLPPSKPFDHLEAASECPQIVAAIEDFKPTAIIGVSGNALPIVNGQPAGRLFSREVIEAMARLNKRPIIFALSNPIEHHECLPEDAYHWSGGNAVYAAGVQFPPVHLDGQTFLPSQANNLYIFPAVGMAVHATRAKRVTDDMFIEAAHAVAELVSPEQLKLGMLFPPQSNILETEIRVATRVAKVVFESSLAGVAQPDDFDAFIRSQVYKPEYRGTV